MDLTRVEANNAQMSSLSQAVEFPWQDMSRLRATVTTIAKFGWLRTFSNRRLLKEIAGSIFICSYLFFTITWLSPSSELKTRIIAPVKVWWQFWGLNQNWSLFSPVIRGINFHTGATITYKDGSKMFVELPRMDRLDLVQRFRYEKFRKWDVDSLPWPDYKDYWPDFARYMGKLYYRADNPPQQLALHLFWTDIPKPTNHLTDRQKLPAHTRFNTVFCYRYDEKDFQ